MGIILFNREIPTRLEEIVIPDQTAVIVVDVQNDFCAPGGRAAHRGANLSYVAAAMAKIAIFSEDARRHGVPVIYIQNTVLPEARLSPVSDLARRVAEWGTEDPLVTIEGTWGHAIVDMLAPRTSDLVIQKFRQSAFVGTNLEMALRASDRKTVIVVGVATHACVETTVRDAMSRDFAVVIARDCVAAYELELHEGALAIMEALLPRGWVTGAEAIRDVWESRVRRVGQQGGNQTTADASG